MHETPTTTIPLIRTPQEEEEPPYRLSNCNFQTTVISYLSHLHKTRSYTDVLLHAEGRILPAHRVVLASGSSYFNSILNSIYNQGTTTPKETYNHGHNNILIALPTTVKYKDLELVIKFLYCGYVDIVNSDLDKFVGLCKELGVVGMVTEDDGESLGGDDGRVNLVGEPNDCGGESSMRSHGDDDKKQGLLHEPTKYYDVQVDQEEDVLRLESIGVVKQNEHYQQVIEIDMEEERGEEEEGFEEFEGEGEYDEDDEEGGVGGKSGVEGLLKRKVEEGGSSNGGSGVGVVLGSNKPFVCSKCGKTYNSNKSLWRHKKFTCDEKIEFKCSVCGKVFSRSDNLRRHVVVAHHHQQQY